MKVNKECKIKLFYHRHNFIAAYVQFIVAQIHTLTSTATNVYVPKSIKKGLGWVTDIKKIFLP